VAYAFPPDPFHDLDAAIEGNNFSLLRRWTQTPPSEQVRQLDLAYSLNSFGSFRWVVATRTMAERHEKYIRESWERYSKGSKNSTEYVINRHIRRHNIDAYEDVARAGGMKCDRKEAKRHLRWSEDFGVAMRCGYNVEELTDKQENGINKLNSLRSTWRLRLTRLTRLRDLIVQHGYSRLRQLIEPGWDGAVVQDVACASANTDGAKDTGEDAAAFDIDRQLTELTIQESYGLGARTRPGSSTSSEDSFEAGEESDDEVWEDVKEFAMEEVVKKGEEKLIDFD
jgi:hypothetical protein